MIEKLKELTEGNVYSVEEVLYSNEEIFGEITCNHYSGGEGEGEDYREVFHLKDHGIYIEVAGNYQSHNGVDYYGDFNEHVYQVYPAIEVNNTYFTKTQTKEDLEEILKKVQEKINSL